MKIKKMTFVIVIFIIAIVALLLVADKAGRAESTGDNPSIYARLDEISRNQKVILEEMKAIKEELKIIKIRITQQQ